MTARPSARVVTRLGDPPVALGQSEAQFQQQVLDVAHLRGWWTHHEYDSRRGTPGWPDLVLVRERIVYAELKTMRGRVSKEQKDVMARLQAAGAEVYLWRPSDILTIANEVLR